MVSISDVGRIAALTQERAQIRLALDNLDHGGTITSMSIGLPGARPPELPSEPPTTVALINTTDWTYPPQMVEAIRQQLEARRTAIEQELHELGITDVGVNQ